MKNELIPVILISVCVVVFSVLSFFVGYLWGENQGLRQEDSNVLKEHRQAISVLRKNNKQWQTFALIALKRDTTKFLENKGKELGVIK